MAYLLPASALPGESLEAFDDWPNANVRTKSVYFPTGVADTSRLDPLTAALLTSHRLYSAYCNDWCDWYNWYSGSMITQYIHRHVRERKLAYQRRQARAYYWNYTKEIVKLYTSFLFSKDISRTFFKDSQDLAEREMMEKNAFWDNIDLKGTKVDAYMMKIFMFTQIFNFVDVIVDMPRTPDAILSEQERQDAGIRPYLYHILPFNAVNWEKDEEGNLLWYRYRESVKRQYDPFRLNPEEEVWRYYTWTRFDWQVHEITFRRGDVPQAVLVDSDINPLGLVPVVRFFGEPDLIEEDCGKSFVSEIGPVNVAIMNYVSLIEEDVYSKVLNLLVIENPNTGSDDLDPTEQGGATEARAGGGIEIGTNNALEWSGSHPPFYLSPTAEPGDFVLKLIEKCIDEIYKLSTLWTDTGIRESRSGVSYSYEFNRSNQMLATKAKAMQIGEEQVHKLYTAWLGERWMGEIRYPETFDIETLMQELDEIMQMKKVFRSPTLIREVEKRAARKVLTHATTQITQQVLNETDTLPSLEEQAAARALEAQEASRSESQTDSDASDDDSEDGSE